MSVLFGRLLISPIFISRGLISWRKVRLGPILAVSTLGQKMSMVHSKRSGESCKDGQFSAEGWPQITHWSARCGAQGVASSRPSKESLPRPAFRPHFWPAFALLPPPLPWIQEPRLRGPSFFSIKGVSGDPFSASPRRCGRESPDWCRVEK